jgi:hypothetical protein
MWFGLITALFRGPSLLPPVAISPLLPVGEDLTRVLMTTTRPPVASSFDFACGTLTIAHGVLR